MNLAIFDLDGTLTDTNEIDTACFLAAWQSEFGIDCSELEWSSFENVTDSAVTIALARRHFDADDWPAVGERVRARFFALLAKAASEKPDSFRAVPGAIEVLPNILGSGWAVAVATGGWLESARIKLEAAGFTLPMPLSGSDCCLAREDVVRHAIRLAEIEHGRPFDRIVVFGDALWDLSAAANLRLPFVAIAHGLRAANLRASGATCVLPDFSQSGEVFDVLRRASAPVYSRKSPAG